MKKMAAAIFCMVFVTAAGSVSAQSQAPFKNTLEVGAANIGVKAEYARAINDKMAVSGEVFVYYLDIGYVTGFDVRFKYFFWRDALYGDVGLGFGSSGGFFRETREGLLFSPGIGYRFDLGHPGGFCVTPSMKLDVIAGAGTQFRIDALFGYRW
jgi:hypothetical protein